MEYMGDGEVLPSPLNLARIPRAICEWVCDCGVDEEMLQEPKSPFDDFDAYENMAMQHEELAQSRNGGEVGIYLLLRG